MRLFHLSFIIYHLGRKPATSGTMTRKEITIGGNTYPVVFNIDAMMIFEEVGNKQFFKANFDLLKDRMAVVYAAVLSANEKTTLTIEKMKGDGTIDAVKEIVAAYNIVMDLAGEFFKIPKVVAVEEEAEKQPEEEGDNPKN